MSRWIQSVAEVDVIHGCERCILGKTETQARPVTSTYHYLESCPCLAQKVGAKSHVVAPERWSSEFNQDTDHTQYIVSGLDFFSDPRGIFKLVPTCLDCEVPGGHFAF